MIHTSFTFSIEKTHCANNALKWLKFLDSDTVTNSTELNQCDVQNWLNVVLRFTSSLLHLLKVPMFESIKIQMCLPVPNSQSKWQATCQWPVTSIVPPKEFEGLLKVAFKLALWCSTANPYSDANRNRFFQFIEIEVRRKFAKIVPRGKSTFEVLRVAHRLNIPFYSLPAGIFQLGMGSASRKIDRSTSDEDSAMGAQWARNKVYAAQLLRQSGLPAPRHIVVKSITQARTASEQIKFPLVVKPADLERGEGVSVDVESDDLELAFNKAFKRSPSKTVLIEQQVSGVCHRIFVLDGEILYAVRRLPVGVYGDGYSSINDLVEEECKTQQLLPPWQRSGIRTLDQLSMNSIERQGWSTETIPEREQFVALRRIETSAWGGVDEDVTTTIHPDNAMIAIQAAKLFELQVAGVDMISQDITKPWYENGAIINEVNYAPLLGGGDISRSHISSYLKTLVKNSGRIPIHVYYGDAKALKSAKECWQGLVDSGLRAVLISSQQVLLSDGKPYMMSLDGVYARCTALILWQDIDALVIAVQDTEFLYTGLPFDKVTSVCDAGGKLSSCNKNKTLSSAEQSKLRKVLKSWGDTFDS